MGKTICFYHGADLDGKCSAAIVAKAYREIRKPLDLYPVDYGKPFPWEKVDGDTDVIMVDFSLQPFDGMLTLVERCKSFIWIDHHKSAISDFERWNWPRGEKPVSWTVRLDTDYAACELTWRYFFGGMPPKSVYLLGRYDIWRWEGVKNAQEFQYGMRAREHEPTDQIWDVLLLANKDGKPPLMVELVIDSGSTVLEYQNRQNNIMVESAAFPLYWEGWRFIVANLQLVNSSVFDSVFDSQQYDGMMTFGFRRGSWTVSLYSTPELCRERGLDFGALAKKHGGGGHPGAAGFQCRELPFDLPLSER
jgi:oligoribonuclease NrnB/cAMP/cGMP phosphodiesterase (DHH superfamily)